MQGIGTTITEYGDAEYIQLETENGKFMVFLNSVLRRLVEQENVNEGDRIAIKFTGYVQSKKSTKKKYKDYILVKDTDSNEPKN